MEGLQKKKGKRPNLLADRVFSWSLDDVHNERLYKSKARKNLSEHLLCKQYRRHPSRSFFPSSSFYDNIFLAAPILKRISHEEKYFKGSLFGHYSFINVIRGWEEKDEDGRNGKNMVDIGIVAQILQNLYKEWADSNQNLSIGIVTPYAVQVVRIKEKLGQKYNNLDGFIVKVKTVDGFQGGEEDLIIFSTGRSNCHQSLEFISKPQSSGVVDYLLSDHEGRELDLLFEVTDQEMDIILSRISSFIVGRSRTGKTTVLTMKLFQIEQWHQLAVRGSHIIESSTVEQSSVATKGKVIRQLFVTVSPKHCYAIKQQVLHLKRFSSGRSHPSEASLIDMVDFDEDEAQFNDLQDPFHEVPPHSYPLSITLHKLLIMLDGTLGNSYFERFLDVTEVTNGPVRSSRSMALQTFKRTEEVTFEKFNSLYWPHFNTELTKKLDATRVFTEMISHIKGSLGALDACDGKCSRDCFVKMSNCASNLSEEIRENIYWIIQSFEKLKMEYGEFDLAEFVTDLQHGLWQEGYKGDHMDFVYIDEVQNLTMNPISLFRHMCHNVEEGFVFSGDTAQTIARGIVFRFQELRHLFYKKFVFESRTNKLDESKEKGQISEILHLTQKFRAHAGILKLSQSIAELLYRFFPESIDVLKPESHLIYGEAPVLLESGENENAIAKIFGNSGNVVGFGAEQVILVRDDSAQNEIANLVGKHALVLTVVECKGLEFQDVLLYNFLGSSPSRNQWRVIYDYMNELDLLDHTLPRGFPSFNVAKHNILCSELEQLYVAVTRTCQRLWMCENFEELSKPIFDYWKKKCLVQVKKLDDSPAHAMQVASGPEEWKSRGMKLYHEHNYEMATMCFERAGDAYWQKRSKAAGLRALADHMRASNSEEARSILREAAEIFDDIGKADSAARCFSDLGEYERAARICLNKCSESELQRPVGCFSSVDSDVSVAEFEKMSLEGQKQEKSFPLQQLKKYTMGSLHGTTILFYQTPTEILVGVESHATRTWKAKDNPRRFEFWDSFTAKKFEADIIQGVHATICGDGDRCKKMIEFVKRKMFALRYPTKKYVATLKDVCEAADSFFRRKPMMPGDKVSIIFICGWNSDLNKYEVYAVGDEYEAPKLMVDKVFGSGSGCSEALLALDNLKTPIDANVMKDQMIKADLIDPYSGGLIKVISLKDGKWKIKYEGRMIEELHDPAYANILFDQTSMFVIILLSDAENLSPVDLVNHLERFDQKISTNHIHWLCFPSNTFCVYRVILSSHECCHTWFNSCGVWNEPVRRQRYTNELGLECDYYLSYARSEILARARSMVSFYDLIS